MFDLSTVGLTVSVSPSLIGQSGRFHYHLREPSNGVASSSDRVEACCPQPTQTSILLLQGIATPITKLDLQQYLRFPEVMGYEVRTDCN